MKVVSRQHSTRYSNMSSSTCFHTVRLESNLLGCYNGLTSSGWVEDASGKIVEELSTEENFDNETGEVWYPNFTPQIFIEAGYVLSDKLDVCRYPDFW